jgi:hypothetical protein
MEITQRELITILHGTLFGGFFVMATFAMIVTLLDRSHPETAPATPASRWQTIYLVAVVTIGWAAVLTGAYVVYPWYRAIAPAGAALAGYPQRLLIASPTTAGWHTLGMEWKEHVAWFAPMAMTMVAAVLLRHRAAWNADRQVRRFVLGFAAVAFLAAALAGGWGILISKAAPVRGGNTIQLLRSTP